MAALRDPVAAVWRVLRSMRTALLLLLLLGLASIAGSLVPQRSNSPLRVEQIFREHPLRARIYDGLQLFDVYRSLWFTIIYGLLFVSLVACLLPRTRALLRNLRTRPQPARELDGFRHYAERVVGADPGVVIDRSLRVLRRRLFRVARGHGAELAAEKGLAREIGSLLFHWSFLLILVGVIVGKGTGFTGFAVITEGQCWTEAHANYDGNVQEGRFFGESHTGIQICVRSFEDAYGRTGVPMDFVTHAELLRADGDPAGIVDVRVNHPVELEGVGVYQYGFGYAPVVEVRRDGEIVASGPIEFDQDAPPPDVSQLSLPWKGILELPSLRPQVGIELELWLDVNAYVQGLPTGEFPPVTKPNAPFMFFWAYRGDLHADLPRLSRGLDTTDLELWSSAVVGAGQTIDLETGEPAAPNARGLTISFPELRQYTVLQVSRDRGVWLELLAAILILAGLLPALYSSRRRVWVRAEPNGAGTVLKVGGFALQRKSQFEEEFARLVDELACAAGERSAGRVAPP